MRGGAVAHDVQGAQPQPGAAGINAGAAQRRRWLPAVIDLLVAGVGAPAAGGEVVDGGGGAGGGRDGQVGAALGAQRADLDGGLRWLSRSLVLRGLSWPGPVCG